MNSEVNRFLENAGSWQNEMSFLRSLALECGLTEEFKWKHPCYTLKGKNVLLIGNFKEYCCLSFLKGALLADEKNILERQTENVQAGRFIRFSSISEIEKTVEIIKAYIFEAIEVENLGLEVKMKTVSDFEKPQELLQMFEESIDFKTAFESLTAGRQKGYLLHFSQAKQSATRIARIEKYKARILNGKGIRDCVCGHSKRMPNCDGSHKHFQTK